MLRSCKTKTCIYRTYTAVVFHVAFYFCSVYILKKIYTVTIYISSYHDDTVKSVRLQRNGIVGMVGGMHGTCHLGLDFFFNSVLRPRGGGLGLDSCRDRMSNIMFTGLGIENVYVNGKLPYSNRVAL